AMTARLNRPNTLSEEELYRVASAVVEDNRIPGSDTHLLGLVPEESRVNGVMDDLRGRDVVTVWDENGELMSGGTLSLQMKQPAADSPFPLAAEHQNQSGSAYLSDVFWRRDEGRLPLITAAENLAGERGSRALVLDPALPDRIPIDTQRSPFQSISWGARDHVMPRLERARAGWDTATGAVSSTLQGPLSPFTTAA